MADHRVYVGNVDERVRESDLKHDFEKYGRLTRFDLKSGFAFVHYQHLEDAQEAIRGLNDRDYEGRRLIVEFGRGGGPRGAGGVHVDPPRGRYGGGGGGYGGGRYGGGGYGGGRYGGGGGYGRDRYDDRGYGRDRGRDRYDDRYDRRDRYRERSRSRDRRRDSRDRSRRRDSRDRSRDRDDSRGRSRDRSRDKSRDRSPRDDRDRSPAADKEEPKVYQIEVDDLPSDTNREDLEDFGKKAGSSVTYAKVYDDRDRCWGIVEYSDKLDFEAALKDLDDQELNGRRVRVTEGKGTAATSSRRDDRSRSARRSTSRSKGRSASPKRADDDDDREKPATGSDDKDD